MDSFINTAGMMWVWIALLVAFLIGEAITPGVLVSIWFAGGAFCSFLFTLFGAPFWLQISVFLVSSLALLIATRPIALRSINQRKQPTNADRILGETGMVISEICNIENRGLIRIGGSEWTARAESDEVIAEGEKVRILRIEGVKAIVEPLNAHVTL